MRIAVRVQPGATQTVVGGRYGAADPPVLVVRVSERAVGGKANQACVAALSVALGIPLRRVHIVAGASSRMKLVEVEGADRKRLAALLEGPAPG